MMYYLCIQMQMVGIVHSHMVSPNYSFASTDPNQEKGGQLGRYSIRLVELVCKFSAYFRLKVGLHKIKYGSGHGPLNRRNDSVCMRSFCLVVTELATPSRAG